MVLFPETRFEAFLAKIAGEEGPDLEPITRTEAFLDDIADGENNLEPRTRIEYWLKKIAENAGGLSIDDIADGTQPVGVLTLNTAASIAKYAFAYRAGITQVIAPNVTFADEYAFYYCNGLTLVRMPSLTRTGVYTFGYISAPSAIMVFPSLSTCAARTFSRGHIGTVDIGPNCSALLADAFYTNGQTPTVDTLILRHTGSAVTAATADTINGLRAVYVPSALISEYTNANYWSAKISAGTITLHAIEGSIYENQYADGTPIGE